MQRNHATIKSFKQLWVFSVLVCSMQIQEVLVLHQLNLGRKKKLLELQNFMLHRGNLR